jgi:hypothetical protein
MVSGQRALGHAEGFFELSDGSSVVGGTAIFKAGEG